MFIIIILFVYHVCLNIEHINLFLVFIADLVFLTPNQNPLDCTFKDTLIPIYAGCGIEISVRCCNGLNTFN